MQSWQAAVVVVVSIVAGAAIPVLVQLSMTLSSARAALDQTTSRAGRALDAIGATAERLDLGVGLRGRRETPPRARRVSSPWGR
jgi:hypothetical protein